MIGLDSERLLHGHNYVDVLQAIIIMIRTVELGITCLQSIHSSGVARGGQADESRHFNEFGSKETDEGRH